MEVLGSQAQGSAVSVQPEPSSSAPHCQNHCPAHRTPGPWSNAAEAPPTPALDPPRAQLGSWEVGPARPPAWLFSRSPLFSSLHSFLAHRPPQSGNWAHASLSVRSEVKRWSFAGHLLALGAGPWGGRGLLSAGVSRALCPRPARLLWTCSSLSCAVPAPGPGPAQSYFSNWPLPQSVRPGRGSETFSASQPSFLCPSLPHPCCVLAGNPVDSAFNLCERPLPTTLV